MSEPPPEQLTADQVRAVREQLRRLPEGAEVLLDRRGQTLYRFRAAGLDLVAKHYRLDTLASRLQAALGCSRAARSERNGRRLLAAGIRTPRPYFHTLDGGLLPRSATLVTAWQPGDQLPDHLRGRPEDHAPLVERVAALTAAFREHRLSHGDYHAKNILVDDAGDLIIVDLDGVRAHVAAFRQRRRYRRDRQRMIGSLKEFPDFARQLDAALPPAS